MLTVTEIFYSIQGESTRAGQPCVFVRLTACDLRCSWCDTPYAFHEGTRRTLDDVLAEVERYGCPLVEITGGEPLLQEDVYPLMDVLLARGRTVMLETGGHRPIGAVPRAVVKIVDVKCPASGEAVLLGRDRSAWQQAEHRATSAAHDCGRPRHRHVADGAFVLDFRLRTRMVEDLAADRGHPVRVARGIRHHRRPPGSADRHVFTGGGGQSVVARQAIVRSEKRRTRLGSDLGAVTRLGAGRRRRQQRYPVNRDGCANGSRMK